MHQLVFSYYKITKNKALFLTHQKLHDVHYKINQKKEEEERLLYGG